MEPVLRPSKVLSSAGAALSAAAHFVTDLRRCGAYSDVRYTLNIPATSTPNGVWTLEGSDDYRVDADVRNGLYGGGSETALWVTLALSGDNVVTKTSASSGATVNAADITTDGSTVCNVVVKCKAPFGYMRWRYTRASGSGTPVMTFAARGA